MEPRVRIAPRNVEPKAVANDKSHAKISLLAGVTAAAAAAAILTAGFTQQQNQEAFQKLSTEAQIQQQMANEPYIIPGAEELVVTQVYGSDEYSSADMGDRSEVYFVHNHGTLVALASDSIYRTKNEICPVSTLEWQQAYKDVTSVKRNGSIRLLCVDGNWGMSVQTPEVNPGVKVTREAGQNFVDRGPAYSRQR
jgi:hypothetical protein